MLISAHKNIEAADKLSRDEASELDLRFNIHHRPFGKWS